jgi:hypothetical protein
MKRVLILALALSVMASSISLAQGRNDENAIKYSVSLGLGTSVPYNPDEFQDNWNPSIGLMLDVAAAKSVLELAANIDYSFFIADSRTPDDINVTAFFLNLKIKPLKSTARPYIFAGAGIYRAWIVDLDVYETVIGFGGGAGVEIEVDKKRRVFIEGKSLHGRTRDSRLVSRRANMEIIPIRMGITFVF